MIKTLTLISALFLGEYPAYYRRMTCEQRMSEFCKKKDICSKIDYVHKSKKDQCFMDFYSDLSNITNHGSNMDCTMDGIRYKNDSVRNVDFTAWKKGCNCME